MSKPDATGTKSLEEILASIRKSLAGEGSNASSGPRGAAAKPGQAVPEPEPPADRAGDDDGDGLLSARLAGALNGPTNGAALDDDFADLLAPDTKKSASPEPAKPADARSEGKDPLWFLRRPSAAAESDSAQPPTARTQPGEGAPTPDPSPVEEVKLSRPEVLRASLPPLFGAEAEHHPSNRTPPPAAFKVPPGIAAPTPPPAAAPAQSEAAKTPPNGLFTARTQPLMPLPPSADETPKTVPAAEAPPAPAAREPTLFREAASAPAAEAVPGPQPPAETKAANGLAVEATADAAAKADARPGAGARRDQAGAGCRCTAGSHARAGDRRAAGARDPPMAGGQPAAHGRGGRARGGGARHRRRAQRTQGVTRPRSHRTT